MRTGSQTATRVGFRTMICPVIVVCLLAGAFGIPLAQQVQKTQTATIKADSLEYDWSTETTVMKGNCHLVIDNDSHAEMTAPAMTVQLNRDRNRINFLEADGVVRFNVTTAPDDNGLRRKISAQAQGGATYRETTQEVKLTGGARADVSTIGTAAQAVHFEGNTITANLKTSRLRVDNAHLKIETPLKED
ncbi:MAG: LptA/OstA family protein [Armatimonadota bacterium]